MTPDPLPRPAEGLAPAADASLGFSVAARHVRGQVVRLDAALNAVLAAHDYPPPLARLLAEALVLTALLGATLRPAASGDDGRLTLQAQASGGAVDLLVCDWRGGALRGYLRHDAARFADLVASPLTLPVLFGSGHLAITLDATATAERYQGIVPLEGDSLAATVAGYFANSEQLPTLLRVAIGGDAATGWLAGGLIVQHLPRAELGGDRLDVGEAHPDWQHVATLAGSLADAELTDPALPPEALLWRLFHEETVRVNPGPTPTRGCHCSPAHIKSVLDRFPAAERAEMRGPDGLIKVDCAFCARSFALAD